MLLATLSGSTGAQTTLLLPSPAIQAIRGESTGEIPMTHFRHIVTHYSGFAPSKGGDDLAAYIAERVRAYGLEDVAIEGFPADGQSFFWAFLTEPAWEAESGTLQMLEPRGERIVDFSVDRVVLGRFSTNADVTADLVDVGAGVSASDYAGKDVKGKLVLATGPAGRAHAEAVWAHGAAGIVWIHTANAIAQPNAVSNPSLVPWRGPHGEAPGFAFGVSYTQGVELRDTLRRGERLRLHATVKATTGAGEYKQVSGVIRGTEPNLPEVWVKGHDNYRNTGGGNNLTGVGATMEIARVLAALVEHGTLTRPRRTIRFLWSAEHYGSIYQFYKHPDRLGRALLLLNVDMVGYHQERAKAIFRLYRTPYSRPHFLSDVAQEFMRSIGEANTISIRNRGMEGPGFYDGFFAPTGSRDQLHYAVEDFWGPSDHEDVQDGAIALPSVLYNDWPDIHLGTQQDNLDVVDATQMRRAVVAIGATAYYLASVTPDAIGRLTPIIMSGAHVRQAEALDRAFALVADASAERFARQYREARNILSQWQRREQVTIDSLQPLADTPAGRAAIARARKQLDALATMGAAAFVENASAVAADRKVTPQEPAPTAAEKRLATVVPARDLRIRGPVNLFRPEYGAVWLAQKTGDEHFVDKVPLASHGGYVTYEALNFVDGKRSVLDIRDALSAEYGPMELADVEQYLRFLAGVGVVTLPRPAGATR
jgi:aminopeptidase YwaD